MINSFGTILMIDPLLMGFDMLLLIDMVLIHWGTVDAPEMTPFNGNPENVIKNVVNPERVVVLKPGEEFIL